MPRFQPIVAKDSQFIPNPDRQRATIIAITFEKRGRESLPREKGTGVITPYHYSRIRIFRTSTRLLWL
jgi:hypothetical protein